MDIIETINIINENYERAYNEYGCYYLNNSAIITFGGGYCYEYFTLLKRFYPQAELMIKNDKMHCATLIDGYIYDVSGLVKDPNNYHVADGCDVEYIYKRYPFFSLGFKEYLHKEVVKNVLNKGVCYKKRNKRL